MLDVLISSFAAKRKLYAQCTKQLQRHMDSEDQHFGAIVLSSEEDATNIHYSQIS
jgi:hypothetical protein